MSKTQVGGDHYKKLGISPFDYSMANNLDAMQHTAIKYITRFRDKNGVEDLAKAKDTIDQLIKYETPKRTPHDAHEVELVQKLVAQIPKDRYSIIFTTGRGGMWLAAQLGYYLDIPDVRCVRKDELSHFSSSRTLFVDSICDTGATLSLLNSIIDSAVLVTKQRRLPTYSALETSEEAYIDFPIGQMADIQKENENED